MSSLYIVKVCKKNLHKNMKNEHINCSENYNHVSCWYTFVIHPCILSLNIINVLCKLQIRKSFLTRTRSFIYIMFNLNIKNIAARYFPCSLTAHRLWLESPGIPLSWSCWAGELRWEAMPSSWVIRGRSRLSRIPSLLTRAGRRISGRNIVLCVTVLPCC